MWGAKITSFGEIYSIWFKDQGGTLGFRDHPTVDLVEQIAVKKIADEYTFVMNIANRFPQVLMDFKNHYSNYNEKDSWAAVSLRGYSTDPLMIEKPIEMNKKWKATHPDWEDMELIDTPLRAEFPALNKWLQDRILTAGDPNNLHRIRFMRLTPGGGELSRHTDQVDPDSGLNVGQVARIHIPIVTNDNVWFSVWEPSGNKKTVNMEKGEVWVLDTRKPHMVVNNGTTDRIHLVIDIKVTPQVKELYFEK